MEPRLVGGHVALDLVNTVAPRVQGGVEHIGSPRELLAWARRVGLLTTGEAADALAEAGSAPDEASLGAVIEIREATYAVLTAALAHHDPPAAALATVSAHWSAAAGRSKLESGGPDDPPVRLAVGADPATRIQDRLAFAALDLLQTVDLARVRVCPLDEGGCGWLFLDRSRNASRRWCAMADCGTQAKSRRLTAHRRAARAGAG
jgi:predicted RNA-binding Zn ribbon-like protein